MPTISRPSAIVSSIAISSASCTGLLCGTIGPSSAILMLSTCEAMYAAAIGSDGVKMRRIVVLGDADPVEPQLLDIPAALDHAAKGAQARLAVVRAGRHRPLPRQVGRRVVAAVFEIRDLHFGASPLSGYGCRYSTRARRRRAATPPAKAGAAPAVWRGRRAQLGPSTIRAGPACRDRRRSGTPRTVRSRHPAARPRSAPS